MANREEKNFKNVKTLIVVYSLLVAAFVFSPLIQMIFITLIKLLAE